MLHFAISLIMALFLWLGAWGSGPQGGEVSRTPQERAQRQRMKPYEDAFMSFLKASDRVLAFPMSRTGSRDLQSPVSTILNSGLWGLAATCCITVIMKRKKPKAQHPPAP